MNEYNERIKALHRQLHIPTDYEQQYGLPRYEEAHELVGIGNDIADRPRELIAEASHHWQAMNTRAKQDGIVLQVVSAFRSVERQAQIIRHKLDKGQAIETILKVSAAPGHSEHHTGRALDLTTPGYPPLEEAFETSKAFRWLQKNAEQFFFSLSYPRDGNKKIAYEPWHWAYRR